MSDEGVHKKYYDKKVARSSPRGPRGGPVVRDDDRATVEAQYGTVWRVNGAPV